MTQTLVVKEAGQPISLAGNFDVADLCLLGALTGGAGVIQARQNGSRGLLALADGALVHASTGDLQGLAAFKKILSWQHLEFDWKSAAPDSLQPNVRLDTAWLLKIASWRQRPLAGTGSHQAAGLVAEVQLDDLFRLLEQKAESGTMTVTAAEGRGGTVVFRDGQVVEAAAGEAQGLEALREIRSWTPVRVSYSADTRPEVPEGAEAPGAVRGLEDLAKLLDELTGEVPDSFAAGIVRISDDQLLVESVRDPLFAGSVAFYSAVMKGHLRAAERVGGGACGNPEDLLMTLEKGYVLIRMLGSAHFQGVVVPRPGNPALTRLVMQRFEPLLLEALERAAP